MCVNVCILPGLPLMDLDFALPFHSLSLDRLLATFGLLLHERPLLFLSCSSARLTGTIEALRGLLFPLDLVSHKRKQNIHKTHTHTQHAFKAALFLV